MKRRATLLDFWGKRSKDSDESATSPAIYGLFFHQKECLVGIPLCEWIRIGFCNALLILFFCDKQDQNTSYEQSTNSITDSTDHIQEVTESDPNPFTEEQYSQLINTLFGEKVIHTYRCKNGCDFSNTELTRLRDNKTAGKPHHFLTPQNWWLSFVEGEGLFCIICRKHGGKNRQNQSLKFSQQPCVRFHKDAFDTHCNSQENLPNVKFLPLIELNKNNLNVECLQHFNYTGTGSVREMFLSIGKAVGDDISAKIRKSGQIGLMIDEVTEISVKNQLVSFVQFLNTESKQIDTAFLNVQDILEDKDLESVLQCLHLLESEATAVGLLRKLQSAKFVGALYILRESNYVNFSHIPAGIRQTKAMLKKLLDDNTALQKLQSDIDSLSQLSHELKFNKNCISELESLYRQYIESLLKNIDDRFSDSVGILSAFQIFDPLSIPKEEDPGFLEYGINAICVLADHFYSQSTHQNVQKTKLLTHWANLKFAAADVLNAMPSDLDKQTPTEWLIMTLVNNPVAYKNMEEVIKLAKIACLIPVSNAWPERGARALKVIKTRLRSPLKNDMLFSLLQVAINGPKTADATPIIEKAVALWEAEKPRRKTGVISNSKSSVASPASAEGVVSDPVVSDTVADQIVPANDLQQVAKELNLEDLSDSDSDSAFEDDFID
ncbi:hypothetical protein KUTeg_004138 [Tegillarca granosa]|uniref:TTF-type domain-containing protein n=1 Tax=Tegillarca granosa TaxID=220873 RepID=A0ABQ9FSV7_TEGGR|nr:hypothetical protein KUTeg_004138 [Tegillarca granosa]